MTKSSSDQMIDEAVNKAVTEPVTGSKITSKLKEFFRVFRSNTKTVDVEQIFGPY